MIGTRSKLGPAIVGGAAVALLLAGNLMGASLQVQTLNVARSATGVAGQMQLRISNQDAGPMRSLRLLAPADLAFDCDDLTLAGRTFVQGGELAAGDTAVCTSASRTSTLRARSSGFVVAAVNADGVGQIQRVSQSLLGTPNTPGQGVVVVLGGAVHNDTDTDGLLDATETIDYHYTALNLGSLALSSLAMTDSIGAVTCGQTTLAVGAAMTCTRNYVISAANQTDGFVLNDVSITGVDSLALPVQGSDVLATLNLAGHAGIRVFKSPLLLDDVDGSAYASVGDLLRYSFVVKNSNAEALTLVGLLEPDPTRIDTPIACAATTLGGQPFAGNGSGTLASNDVVLCTADYVVRVADQTLGQALNLVEADGTAAIAGTVVATGASAVVVPGAFLISVNKTVDATAVFPGDTVVYTVVLSNPGTLAVANVTITDPLPAGVTSFNWTCVGASCPNPAGSGAINESIASFPAGAVITYTVQAVIGQDPPDTVINTVSVTPPGITQCAPANLPPPCQSTVPLVVLPSPTVVPTNATWAAILLMLGLIATGRRALSGRPLGARGKH